MIFEDAEPRSSTASRGLRRISPEPESSAAAAPAAADGTSRPGHRRGGGRIRAMVAARDQSGAPGRDTAETVAARRGLPLRPEPVSAGGTGGARSGLSPSRRATPAGRGRAP